LIGLVEPLKDREPIASVLVLCQLLSAFLLAWLFEWVSRSKNSMAVRPRAFATHRKVLTAGS
jgi:ABC-type Fe3+ transport system permease subunit